MIKPGFVPVRNELFDWLIKEGHELTKREMIVYLAIMRNTLGYSRSSWRMSVRYIGQATGIDYRNVHTVLKGLKKKGWITINNDKRTNIITIFFPNLDESIAKSLLSDRQQIDGSPQETVVKSTTELLPNRQQDRCQIDDKYKQKNTNRTTNKEETEELEEWLL